VAQLVALSPYAVKEVARTVKFLLVSKTYSIENNVIMAMLTPSRKLNKIHI